MHRSLRLRRLSGGRRLLAVVAIALSATAVAFVATAIPGVSSSIQAIDLAFYDAFYKSRTPLSKHGGDIVIIAVDQSSIDRMAAEANHYRWPWPREYWGLVLQHLQQSGARVVALDLLMEEPSAYERETGDDASFAGTLDQLTIPVVHAARVSPNGAISRFAPPVQKPPTRGAVNVIESAVVRRYASQVGSVPSMALQTLLRTGTAPPAWADEPFLLHYYGPNKRGADTTFRYVGAYDVIRAAMPDAPRRLVNQSRELFKDRIVLIGATADGTFDLKSAPVSALYPGVEAHATAIANLLEGRRVRQIGFTTTLAISSIAALLAAAGAVTPRRVTLKVPLSLAVVAGVFVLGYSLFVGSETIRWLPLAAPLLSAGLATVAGLGWSYLVEDHRRRVLLRFLSQYVSPEVADELNRRGEISLGGVRREMTVMFTDIAGFTEFSGRLSVEQLEAFMNFYLSEMSQIVFDRNGTLDKYVGDAIMSFWNAPLDQPDHAISACHAALGMCRREQEIQPQIQELGLASVLTRVGINTGPMVVGNFGSQQKVNYTVLGDAVNLASRLEGANKIYGTQILVAEPTVMLAKGSFLFRRLDLLRVKGRAQPMPVYELMAEGAGSEAQQKLAREFDAALALYFKQDWSLAEARFVELLSQFPDDSPTRVFLQRIRVFRAFPPPPNWDGVHEQMVK